MKNYIIIAAISAIAVVSCKTPPRTLPIYGERSAVQKIVDGRVVTDTLYKTIPEFSFLNQDSVMINNHLFDGKIYVADFFFTTCPTICPTMHRNLLEVYNKYKGNKNVMFLSHSIDFKYDLPYILKSYADKLGVSAPQWQFIHGSREQVYGLAQKDYLVSVMEDASEPGGYVHQGYLVLVDKQKRVRGGYDGTKKEEVDQLIKDMDVLMEESDQKL